MNCHKKLTLYVTFFLLLVTFVHGASAEMFLWQETAVDNVTQTVNYHAFYQFEDTSANNVGRNKPIPVQLLYQTQNLPFAIGNGAVDYCNFTIKQYLNDFDSLGNIINTTFNISSFYFNTGVNTDSLTFNMKDKDTLIADMVCHYTTPESVFFDSILVGQYTTFLPSFECKSCTDKTLEELSKETANNEIIITKEITLYSAIQSLINMNFQILVIISWFIKIALFIVAIGAMFSMAYYLYEFINGIAR